MAGLSVSLHEIRSTLENISPPKRPTVRNHRLVQWGVALFKEKVTVSHSVLSSLPAKGP